MDIGNIDIVVGIVGIDTNNSPRMVESTAENSLQDSYQQVAGSVLLAAFDHNRRQVVQLVDFEHNYNSHSPGNLEGQATVSMRAPIIMLNDIISAFYLAQFTKNKSTHSEASYYLRVSNSLLLQLWWTNTMGMTSLSFSLPSLHAVPALHNLLVVRSNNASGL